MAKAIELAWRRGARMDGWSEHMDAQRWWTALADVGINIETALHKPHEVGNKLPWDHVAVKYGREFLEKEQNRSVVQLREMSDTI